MNVNCARKLGFKIRKINIRAQKIDGFALEIFEMVINSFQIIDKIDRSWYFQKKILVVDTKVKKILKMFYLRFININMFFGKKILMWRSYTINRALPIIK